MILIIFNYAVLALTFVLARCAVLVAQPLFVIAVRMTLAGSVLLAYALYRGTLRISRRDVGDFAQLILLHIYLPFVAEFWALQYMPSAKMNLLYTLTPFIAGILSYFLLNERLSTRRSVALGIGLFGALPLLSRTTSWWSIISSWHYSIPEFVALGAVFCATYAWFIIRRLLDRGYSSAVINGVAMLGGGLLAGVSCLASTPLSEPLVSSWPAFWWSVIGLMILANGIFYNLQTYLMHRYSINVLMFAGCLSPLFGALFGLIFLHEQLTWHFALSLGLVSCALGIYYSE